MAADGVEAERLRLPELVLEIGEVGDGVEAFGIIVLIERAPHIERLPVEQELPVLRRDRAEAEAARRGVAHRRPVAELDRQPVQIGAVGRPRRRVRHRQPDGDQRPSGAVDAGADDLPVGPGHCRDQRHAARRRRDRDRNADRARCEIGAEDDLAEMGARAAFEPDRLPYPAHRAVPALLAVGDFLERVIGKLGAVVRRQGDLHLEAVVGPQRAGIERDLEAEIAALVRRDPAAR